MFPLVITGLVPVIHVGVQIAGLFIRHDVDARNKSGHDGLGDG